jgi:hypothetical protein
MRRLTVVGVVLGLACGGGRNQIPVPATTNDAVKQFLDAVQARDIPRMGRLWGSARGPAAQWMSDSVLQMRMSVVQRYLTAPGYRIVEGPLPVPGRSDRRLFQVELQRPQCVHVQPIEVVQTHSGGWVVADVHLESATTPGSCRPGTRP